MPELNMDNIETIILFVAPGFISLKVWGLLNSAPRRRVADALVEAVIFSSFNAIFFYWLFDLVKQIHPILAYFVVFIMLPVLWPVVFYNLARIPYFKTRLTPTAWDYFFNLKEDCFLRLHLKNGLMLGGLYSVKSFASSYPEKEGLYLAELWEMDEDGVFQNPVENTDGLLVNFEEVSFIEIFKLDFSPTDKFVPNQT
jgi:hypothetical protein